ncbi:MAG: RNA polymerase sigma factor [Chloroflexota bacterium]
MASFEERIAEDRQLVRSALLDREAFAELYHRNVTPVYRYLYRQVGNLQDTEDLVSVTFRKAIESLDRYKADVTFTTWLFGIARHTLRDHQRASRVRDRQAAGSLESKDSLTDPAPQPDAKVMQLERLELLNMLVAKLPTDQREALLMRMSGDLRTREIAQVMGRSEAAVKMLIHRAVLALRASYAPYTEEIPR